MHRLSEGDPTGFSDALNLLIRTKFTRKPIQSEMVRLVEEARSAARQRIAQVSTSTQPQCKQKVDALATSSTQPVVLVMDAPPQTFVTEHLVPVMGKFPPPTSQEEFFPPGLQNKGKRGWGLGHGSQLASREILADITHNVPSNDQQNGADVLGAMEASNPSASHGHVPSHGEQQQP